MTGFHRTAKRSSLPLWVKLLVGYLLVALTTVGIVAILANRSATRQFQVYVSQGRQWRAQQLALEFAAYYAQTGSWAGVEPWMANLATLQSGVWGQGRGQGRGNRQGSGTPQGTGSASDRLLLTDASGRIIADSADAAVGETLTDAELLAGVAIESGGQNVGTLLVTAPTQAHASMEAEFRQQINRSLLWAGLAAVTVAIVVGLLLARQLTAPLRALTAAAQRLARWKPGRSADQDVPQVEVRGQDEIGELGQAFNTMARSLAEEETLRRTLMADIAHELRTPLTVIRGDLEGLLDGVLQPTPETLASLQEEALLLSRLVDDLRALALAEAGQLQLQRQPTNLADLLNGVAASLSQQARSLGVTLELHLPPALPLVLVDAQRIRQVIANLLSNALRHASEPAGTGRIEISAVEQPAEVQVLVVDNGPGITLEELPHIFDRFWQGQRARAGSSGLGLAIARELVRAHGGQIWVESAVGRGATFRFTLPLTGSSPEPAGLPDGGNGHRPTGP